MKDINIIIQNSKNQILSSYFKIKKNEDNSFSIVEYFGPKKSYKQMRQLGYAVFSNLLEYINEKYPIFDINDFKAVDEHTIVKKTEDDLINEEVTKIIKYYELSEPLFQSVKKLKELLILLSIKYFEFAKFSDLKNYILSSINSNTMDGIKYISLFSNYVDDIYCQLEKIGVSAARDLFDNKFNYFIALIK